ncbi:lytic transglycosylase domain-containing protein [Sinorhizobium garamanticum]|uniref:Lytic transglycosylase domain-containing protein n=2 Tax=Sinorhizobium garamanticum TaxID=680247 RepID=A0ABY8DF15_9HYPH|nr:lytic transglycosylase domain-containing protein [Sinorhizobium garamanticum]WEX89474.1 lytic transglycosylase domain-containing protein [Sinorhizobium garamanticum]
MIAFGLPRAARLVPFLLLSGLFVAALPHAGVTAQTAPTARPAPADSYAAHIAEAAQRFAIPQSWIRAVMRAESAGDMHALSRAGAIGLMQIMPDTWAELRVRYRLGNDPYAPRDNILAGAAYLREMYDRYGSPGFLAAYNAGPKRYDEHLASGRQLPAETRAYVASIAPLLGPGYLAGVAVATAPEQPSWMQAPLFVTRTSATPTAREPAQPQRTDGAEKSSVARNFSAPEPRTNALFVARNEPRGAP